MDYPKKMRLTEMALPSLVRLKMVYAPLWSMQWISRISKLFKAVYTWVPVYYMFYITNQQKTCLLVDFESQRTEQCADVIEY